MRIQSRERSNRLWCLNRFRACIPGVEYGWEDGHGAGGEANNPDGGLPLSYGAALPDTFGEGGLLAGEEGLSGQPHSALSIMIPGAEERSPSSSGTRSTDAFGGKYPLSEEKVFLEHPAAPDSRSLCEVSLNQKDLNTLIEAVETLLYVKLLP
ncbi:hypothetical protein Efla_006695 [Eimeria flavescens]